MDRVADRENRTRSELLREAFRQYVERRERWDAILAKTEATGRAVGRKSDDEIVRIVKEHRRQKRESRVAAGKR